MGLVKSIAGLFSRFASWSFRSTRPAAHELGRRGERLAARHLEQHGYRVLYRNFRPKRGGEVDLVCRDKRRDVLVFVEVKTRSRTDFGPPSAAVNSAKRELLERGARAWLRLLENDAIIYRFDIVEVIVRGDAAEVRVIENAFAMD